MSRHLPDVNCSRGAPMGRSGDWSEPVGKVRLHLMKMSPCGAYDEGGAYWGCGNHKIGWMYQAYDLESDFSVFIRAKSRDQAKAEILEQWPEAKFFR